MVAFVYSFESFFVLIILNNFRFTTMFSALTKHGNNHANCRIALEKFKKIWICLTLIYIAVINAKAINGIFIILNGSGHKSPNMPTQRS